MSLHLVRLYAKFKFMVNNKPWSVQINRSWIIEVWITEDALYISLSIEVIHPDDFDMSPFLHTR